MALPGGVSELADNLGNTDFFGSRSDDDSAGSSAPDGGGDRSSSDSLDSTYLLQSNAMPFYEYATPSVISQNDPHAEAPAQPVFGCVAA